MIDRCVSPELCMRIAPYYVSFSLSPSPSIGYSSHFSFPPSSTFRSSLEISPLPPRFPFLLRFSPRPDSVPDLFFFCLNLVAIRSGHTPRRTLPSAGFSRRGATTRHRTGYTYVKEEDRCVRARIFDAFCLARRRSRSTGADLCLVIRKLLRSRGSSLTIGRGIFLFASSWPRRHMSPPISSDVYDCCDPA